LAVAHGQPELHPGEETRLRVVLGTGLKTPTGIITEGSHDASLARFTYGPDNDGDETVTGTSALDDFHGTPDTVKLLNGVTHGQLMTDPQFLAYLWDALAAEPLVAERPQLTASGGHRDPRSTVSETIP
jgi:hypothetical protein